MGMTAQQFLELLDRQRMPTEALFRSVPPDRIEWTPGESIFTLGQHMAHMAGALSVYANGIASGDWGFTSMRERLVKNRSTPSLSVEEGLSVLGRGFDDMHRLVGGLTDEEFNSGEVNAPQLGGLQPRWKIAQFGLEHHITHKSELFMCLRILGARVHTGTLYRG